MHITTQCMSGWDRRVPTQQQKSSRPHKMPSRPEKIPIVLDHRPNRLKPETTGQKL